MEEETIRLINILAQFVICGLIMPMHAVCIFTLLRIKEFYRNASLQIVVRLIVLDFFQTAALLVTGFYYVFPGLVEFQFLRKICSVILISFFLGLFPLQLELTVYRILVVTKVTGHQKLPLFMKVFEVIIWIGILIMAVLTWTTDAFDFEDGSWFYNEKSWIAPILARAELYFCLPVCVVTYVLYTVLIIMIFSKASLFAKEELPFFLQCTTMLLSETVGIVVYHIPEIADKPEIYDSPWFSLFNTVNWTSSFGWTSLFLLICNRTVRSKLWWRSPTPSTRSITLLRSGASH